MTTVPIVCPACRADALGRGDGTSGDDSVVCAACGQRFGQRGAFLDLVIGSRFPDERDDVALASEEASSHDTALNFWLPLFRRFWPDGTPSVLSVGCGVGADVDLLRGHGIAAMGVDPGSRTRTWARRRSQDALVLANGQRLPFADGSFDAAFCGCVYPHVGVVGDSSRPAPDCWSDRAALAREMVRVLKPGGRIFASSANRLCPVDVFHGPTPGAHRPRVNPPWSGFLLSVRDYALLFDAAGAERTTALAMHGYWGFLSAKKTLKGRMLSLPMKAAFAVVSSRPGAWLRGSCVDPWIVVTAQKR